MRDEELLSLVLGVILIGVLMAGGVWAFMRWGTPPDDPFAGKGRSHGIPQRAGEPHTEVAPAADVHATEAHPGAPGATGGHHPPTRHEDHGDGSHGAAPVATKTPAWPVKPRQPRPTLHPEGH
jgi:hypothetical protein